MISNQFPNFFTCIEKTVTLYLWLRGHSQVQHNVRVSNVQVDILSLYKNAIYINEVKWMRYWRDELPVSIYQLKRLEYAAANLAELTGRNVYIQGIFCSSCWPFVTVVPLYSD